MGAKRWIEDPILYIFNQPFAVASILFWPVACSLFLIVFSGTNAVHMARMTHMFDRPSIISLSWHLSCFVFQLRLELNGTSLERLFSKIAYISLMVCHFYTEFNLFKT